MKALASKCPILFIAGFKFTVTCNCDDKSVFCCRVAQRLDRICLVSFRGSRPWNITFSSKCTPFEILVQGMRAHFPRNTQMIMLNSELGNSGLMVVGGRRRSLFNNFNYKAFLSCHETPFVTEHLRWVDSTPRRGLFLIKKETLLHRFI